jgi:hypothetical protein
VLLNITLVGKSSKGVWILGVMLISIFLAQQLAPLMLQNNGKSQTNIPSSPQGAGPEQGTYLLWNNSISGTTNGEAQSVWVNSSHIYSCGTVNYGPNQNDIVISKHTTDGDLVWNRTWGDIQDEEASSIWVQGEFIYTCGNTASFGGGNNDVVLIKWNATGDQIWNRTWGGTEDDYGIGIVLNSTNILICGLTASYGHTDMDYLIINYDFAGNRIWNRTHGGNDVDGGYSLRFVGSDIYSVGITASYGAGNWDLYLLKMDNAGNLLWNTTWGVGFDERPYDLEINGGYIYVCGAQDVTLTTNPDLFLCKFDLNGNFLWNRTWGSIYVEEARDLQILDNKIYVSGYEYLSTYTMESVVVVWDENGSQLWARSCQELNTQESHGIWANSTDIYTVGLTYNQSSTNKDYNLMKWANTHLPSKPLLDTTPSPSTTGNITLDWNDVGGATFYLVYQETTPITSAYGLTPLANLTALTLDITDLNDGTYYYSVQAGNASGVSSLSTLQAMIVAKSSLPSAPVLASIAPNPSATGNITLDWNDVMGASSYKVYRNNITITTVSVLTPLATPTESIYIDRGLTNGTYYYAVVATNPSGDSLPSNCKWVIVAIQPPVSTTTTTTTGTTTATNSSTSSSSTSAATASTSESSVAGYPVVWFGIMGVIGVVGILVGKKKYR